MAPRAKRMLLPGTCAVLAAAVVLALPHRAAPDTLVTTDGRTFQGRVIRRDAGQILFEIRRHGSAMQMAFPASEVASVRVAPAKPPAATKPARPAGPTYYVVPVRGEIGVHFTAELLDRCLADAASQKPTVLLLAIDSPGGSIPEADRILRRLGSLRGVRLVACVGRALSAAAIIAMRCPEIYVASGATIGGATAYQVLPWGAPAAVAEKMQSVWRATCRAAAEQGGHEGLLAEAMVDSDVELHVVREGGTARVLRGAGKDMLTSKGKLLTLTAKEAVGCGLARAVADDPDSLGRMLGYPKWSKSPGKAEQIVAGYALGLQRAVERVRGLHGRFQGYIRSAYDAARPAQSRASYAASAMAAVREAKKLGDEYPQLRLNQAQMDETIRKLSEYHQQLQRRR